MIAELALQTRKMCVSTIQYILQKIVLGSLYKTWQTPFVVLYTVQKLNFTRDILLADKGQKLRQDAIKNSSFSKKKSKDHSAQFFMGSRSCFWLGVKCLMLFYWFSSYLNGRFLLAATAFATWIARDLLPLSLPSLRRSIISIS